MLGFRSVARSHYYRYQSAAHLDRLKTVLLEHVIYYPTPGELNDPADCRPRLTAVSGREVARFLNRYFAQAHPAASLLEAAVNLKTVNEALGAYGLDWMLREMQKQLHQDLANTHVFSMSKRWDNMGLWAKYADNHTGYCLEFANAGLFSLAQEVEYGDVFPVNLSDPLVAKAAFMLFFRKTNDWASEEEVRLVSPTVFPSSVPFEPALLARIILGKDMPQLTRDTIHQWNAIRKPTPTVVVAAMFDDYEQRLKIAARASAALS